MYKTVLIKGLKTEEKFWAEMASEESEGSGIQKALVSWQCPVNKHLHEQLLREWNKANLQLYLRPLPNKKKFPKKNSASPTWTPELQEPKTNPHCTLPDLAKEANLVSLNSHDGTLYVIQVLRDMPHNPILLPLLDHQAIISLSGEHPNTSHSIQEC